MDKLKHAQKEAKYVVAKVGGSKLRPADDKTFKKAIAGKDYDLLHVACHGAADSAPGIQTIRLEHGATVSSIQSL